MKWVSSVHFLLVYRNSYCASPGSCHPCNHWRHLLFGIRKADVASKWAGCNDLCWYPSDVVWTGNNAADSPLHMFFQNIHPSCEFGGMYPVGYTIYPTEEYICAPLRHQVLRVDHG